MLDPQLIELVVQYPDLVKLLLVMSTCRLIFKPLFEAYCQYVKNTPSKADDRKLQKFLNHPKLKLVVFLLDLLFSIKVPKQEKRLP